MSRTPPKITDELRNEVWLRDKGTCQNCDKKLSKIKFFNPYNEVLEELHSLKEILIYRWERNCWKCKRKTPRVSYDIEVNFSYHIGDIQKIDEILMEKYPFVKRKVSYTLGEEVIANICTHCGELQGNFYISEELLNLRYEGIDNFIDIVLPNNLKIEDLDIDREDPMLQEYEVIERFGHIHHIDGDTTNNNLENLILLCPSCHKKADIKRRKKKANNI
jgi:hypothetical protein